MREHLEYQGLDCDTVAYLHILPPVSPLIFVFPQSSLPH